MFCQITAIALMIGNVTLHTSVGIRTIHDVFFVPALAGRHNLLSIRQIVRKGCTVTMSRSGCKVFSDAVPPVLLLEGSFTGHGFLVDMLTCRTTTQIAKLDLCGGVLFPTHLRDEGRLATFSAAGLVHLAMLAGSSDTQPIEIWHMRLGHLNQAAIRHLSSSASGLHIGPAHRQTLSMSCESCLMGAQHKNISHNRSAKATRRLEHVWADIKGPLLHRDVYGFRFFCVFICEFTRWAVVYPLLEKGHAFGTYKLYEARYERLASQSITHLHIDGGTEFLSHAFRSHLRDSGVALCVTQPYSPEMNSIAERSIRTITEHASAMLWNASLPVSFWSSAVDTAVYLLNRSPHSALGGKTPFEAWHGTPPNLGHLRVFCCRAAAHVPDELRTKTDWTSKSTPHCIFIGYSETENLFKLWNVEKRCYIRRRDVIFWENEMGHPSLRPQALTHGVSIDPSLGPAGITSAIADSEADALAPPSGSALTPSSSVPLAPLDTRQTVSKLPPEPSEQQCLRQGGQLRFIPYQPPAANIAILPTPAPPAASGEDVVPDPRDRPEAFGGNVEFAMALTTAIDVFDLAGKEFGDAGPIIIPPLDRDVPRSYKQGMSHPRRDRWLAAMHRELNPLRTNDTWDLVPLPPGRKAFPNKWVFSYVTGPKLS